MPKKAKSRMTPSRALWHIIDSEMRMQHVTQTELARRVSCNKCTVSEDSRAPERIPLCRLWLYFAALGIDIAEILQPVAEEHAARICREVMQ